MFKTLTICLISVSGMVLSACSTPTKTTTSISTSLSIGHGSAVTSTYRFRNRNRLSNCVSYNTRSNTYNRGYKSAWRASRAHRDFGNRSWRNFPEDRICRTKY